jgi:hypothetical protein
VLIAAGVPGEVAWVVLPVVALPGASRGSVSIFVLRSPEAFSVLGAAESPLSASVFSVGDAEFQ